MTLVLRLGNRTIPINMVVKVDAQDSHGEYCDERGEIRVSTAQPEFAIRDSIVHEIGHVLWDLMGLSPGQKIGEEQFCRMMASGMLMACHQNPWMIDILAGRMPADEPA